MNTEVDWDAVKDFGRMSDRELAAKLRCSSSAVRRQRTLRGIPPFRPDTRAKGIDWDAIPDLGEVPDAVIAERVGCKRWAVCYARQQRGIVASVFR